MEAAWERVVPEDQTVRQPVPVNFLFVCEWGAGIAVT